MAENIEVHGDLPNLNNFEICYEIEVRPFKRCLGWLFTYPHEKSVNSFVSGIQKL